MNEVTLLSRKEKKIILIHGFGCSLALILFIYFIVCFVALLYPQKIGTYEVLSREFREYRFGAYHKSFAKSYGRDEYQRRLNFFKESLLEIEALNRQSILNNTTAKFGFTKFSDMSRKEFEKTMTMNLLVNDFGNYNKSCPSLKPDPTKWIKKYEDDNLPPSINWRNIAFVGPILTQGLFCQSCWAHSIVGVMETMLSIVYPKERSLLSIQELADCSDYNYKCAGGNPETAVEYLCRYQLPLVSEYEYPLRNKNGTCRYQDKKPEHGVTIKRMFVKRYASPREIASILANHGPVVAAINPYPLRHYLGGVIKYHCSGDVLDDKHVLKHVVQIVGYDNLTDTPHFIIRNSWGSDWGDSGYLYTALEDDICGIGRLIVYFDIKAV